jgi:hypothetical protein
MNMIADEMIHRFGDLLAERGWHLVVHARKVGPEGGILADLHTRGPSIEIEILLPAEAAVRNRMVHGLSQRPAGGYPQLLLMPKVRPTLGEFLRQADLSFADLSGNMYLNHLGLYIDIRGQRLDKERWPDSLDELVQSPRAPLDLSTPIRAQVVFALVTWPELFHMPIRDVSRAAGTSLGAAQSVVGSLREQYPDWTRVARAELYKQWLTAYPRRLLPKLGIAEFEAPDPRSVRGEGIYLSGESALPDLVGPATATVYTESLESNLINQNRWRRSSNPNVYIRRKFWESPFGHRDELTDLGRVPVTLIYADLLATGDPRLKEVAQQIAWDDIQLRELVIE